MSSQLFQRPDDLKIKSEIKETQQSDQPAQYYSQPAYEPECIIVPPTDCSTTVYQTMEICVPITITPTASVGKINVKCCGKAVVSNKPCPIGCPKSYTFYVRRTICTITPITFSADGSTGAACASFETPNQTGCNCPAPDTGCIKDKD